MSKLTIKVKVVLPESPSAIVGLSIEAVMLSSFNIVTTPVSVISILAILTVVAILLSMEIFTVSSGSVSVTAVGFTSKLCDSPAVPVKVSV